MTIKTPRGKVIHSKWKNGSIKAELQWNPGFGSKLEREYGIGSKWQRAIDTTVLKGNEPYLPFKTGMLVKSGTLGTVIGSGEVAWIAPYARKQYYQGRVPGESNYGGLRGKLWFERWKQDHAADMIAQFRQAAKAGA